MLKITEASDGSYIGFVDCRGLDRIVVLDGKLERLLLAKDSDVYYIASSDSITPFDAGQLREMMREKVGIIGASEIYSSYEAYSNACEFCEEDPLESPKSGK